MFDPVRVPQVGEMGQYGALLPDGRLVPVAALVMAVIPAADPATSPAVEICAFCPSTLPPLPVHTCPPLAATLTAGCWSPLPLRMEFTDIAGSLVDVQPMGRIVGEPLRMTEQTIHVHVHLDADQRPRSVRTGVSSYLR